MKKTPKAADKVVEAIKESAKRKDFESAYRKKHDLTDQEAGYLFRFADESYRDIYMQARWEGYQLAKEDE